MKFSVAGVCTSFCAALLVASVSNLNLNADSSRIMMIVYLVLLICFNGLYYSSIKAPALASAQLKKWPRAGSLARCLGDPLMIK
jgi:hypothetical protein